MLDMTVFSVLAQLLMVHEELACPLRDYLTENYQNLVSLVNRVKDRAWAEHWEEATGDKLHLNPHIPKPEPVVEEDKAEETEKKDEGKTDEEKKDEKEEVKEEKEEEDKAEKKD